MPESPAAAVRRQQAESAARIPVRSSHVRFVAYLPEFARLFVWFGPAPGKRGERLLACYDAVPPDVYSRLLNAPSKGTFVYDVIRGAGGKRASNQGEKPQTDHVYPYTPLGGW